MMQQKKYIVTVSSDAGLITWDSTYDSFDEAADRLTQVIESDMLDEGEVAMISEVASFYQQH